MLRSRLRLKSYDVTPSRRYSVHHKSHMDWPGIEAGLQPRGSPTKA